MMTVSDCCYCYNFGVATDSDEWNPPSDYCDGINE